MSKIGIILEREYMQRVKKKSFVIMTFLGPVLMAALFVVPILLQGLEDEDYKSIAVLDASGQMEQVLQSSEMLSFDFLDPGRDLETLRQEGEYYGILLVPKDYESQGIKLFSTEQPSINIKSQISSAVEAHLRETKLLEAGIRQSQIDSLRAHVALDTIRWREDGSAEASSTEIAMAVGFILAFMIYMFVFIYGSQVMRGVIEEKTNRIVEVLASSVKPFEMMMGKVLGVALVALTQFAVWVVLTIVLVWAAQATLLGDMGGQMQQMNLSDPQAMEQIQNMDMDWQSALMNLNYFAIVGWFIFYFIGGYLLYAALFAAVGAAVDNETETQQFILPITLPMILAFVLAQNIIANPDGSLAFWLSVIPFTSPVVMLVRIPFESVSVGELLLSAGLLVATFVLTIWLAAKIYRTGILMYGKKITYAELWKWIRYGG